MEASQPRPHRQAGPVVHPTLTSQNFRLAFFSPSRRFVTPSSQQLRPRDEQKSASLHAIERIGRVPR